MLQTDIIWVHYFAYRALSLTNIVLQQKQEHVFAKHIILAIYAPIAHTILCVCVFNITPRPWTLIHWSPRSIYTVLRNHIKKHRHRRTSNFDHVRKILGCLLTLILCVVLHSINTFSVEKAGTQSLQSNTTSIICDPVTLHFDLWIVYFLG